LQRGYERFEIVVRQLSDKRGSAIIAQALYVETEDSIAKREMAAVKRKLAAMQRPHSDYRPNKQERRKIRQFTGKSET
ncbi:MAG: RNA-binding protein, partial [Gammaproteobacteria bacterium]|nr:RNA-binding protein [Gammaproteobacteria bacterium]